MLVKIKLKISTLSSGSSNMSITDHGTQEKICSNTSLLKLKSAMSNEGRLCGWCGSVKMKKNWQVVRKGIVKYG